ncbi:MAG: asparaginase domain-containing protein [Candidatus Woesearchaeota archaeon]|jgi:hypothetical protein
MRSHIVEELNRFKQVHGKPYKLAVVNWGGTLTCVSNEKGLLEPVQKESELESILFGTLGFERLVDSGILDVKIIYHGPLDSSQMLDPDREPALKVLEQEYLCFDGFLGIHGTDTAAKTGRFLHLNLPHYDPEQRWTHDKSVHNWTKPFPIVSSQDPASEFVNGKLVPLVGSDAGSSIVTAMSILVDSRFGEVGCLVNRELVYRATAYDKGSESHYIIFDGDRGIPPLAERTAFGITFTGPAFDERPRIQDRTPFVIHGSAQYEGKVLTVSELSHLESCKTYLRAVEEDRSADEISRLRATLPRVILYVSKGAGNVQEREYEVLKQLEKLEGEATHVARVPLRGGRVPREMHYAVPGGDLPGYNIEHLAARYKAQSVLALMDQLKIEQPQQKEFFRKMMESTFAREFLPYT